ncbi:MAG: C40 family peptidase [Chlorobiaceae bacterium]|nr:C40 family peptidase [Chlorobiaceae bacterium]
MNEIARFMTPQAKANPTCKTAILLALSCIMLAIGGCRSTLPLSNRMESKYSLKKRKSYISCAGPESLARCALPVHVSGRDYMKMLELIETVKGSKYRYGGCSPEGFDCSGLVQFIYGSSYRITLPRSSADLALLGQIVTRQKLKPGDLLFFSSDNETVDHVGIYLGDERFAHASSREGVCISSLRQGWYDSRFAFGTSIIEVD